MAERDARGELPHATLELHNRCNHPGALSALQTRREPRRVCRTLQALRGWSDAGNEALLT